MKIMVINGPNLNMVGIREKEIYGVETYEEMMGELEMRATNRGLIVSIHQSNHEGDLIDWIQKAYFDHYDGVVINPGAYTHTSIALMDAVKAIAPIPVVEVHLTDVNEREDFRKVSYIGQACAHRIMGQGFQGYLDALEWFVQYQK